MRWGPRGKETRVKRTAGHVFSTIVAIYYPFCTASVRPTLPPSEVHMAELWQRPDDLASRDLFYGPWGREDGWHKELFQHISAGDVRWASELLAGLTDRQWSDAFRAGGYEPAVADRFIRRLHQKIADGQRLGDGVLGANPQP
jgi:hypothetical protein